MQILCVKMWCYGAAVLTAVASFPLVARGDLLVTDQLNNRVLRFDQSTGALLGVFGEADFPGSGLLNPNSIEVYNSHVFVSSSNADSILRYDTNGDLVAVVAQPDLGAGAWDDIAIDANGVIHAASHTAGIRRYDLPGNDLGLLAGSDPATLLNGDSTADFGGLNFDAGGNLYVVISDPQNVNDAIVRFAPDGSFLGTFGDASNGSSPIDSPYEIAFDSSGNILLADANSGILKFDASGAYLGTVVADYGISIAIDDDDHIYLGSSGGAGFIKKYDSDGDLVATLVPSGWGLSNVSSIAFAPVPEPGSCATVAVLALFVLRGRLAG